MDDAELRSQLECVNAAAFGWARACCRGDRDDAEEVLHDVYARVLDGSVRFGAQSSFRTWLFGVIRLTAAARRRRDWLRNLILERRVVDETDLAPGADDDMDRESRIVRLQSAVAKLARRQREVLHLVFYEELTVEAAAEVMGVSVGSARTHYARGKARLAVLIGSVEDL